MYSTLIFGIIMNGIVPRFGSYLYYYQIVITGFSQFEYSLLSLIGWVTVIIGSILF